MKKLLTSLLCIIMVIGLVPMTDIGVDNSKAYATVNIDQDYLCFEADGGDVTIELLQTLASTTTPYKKIDSKLSYYMALHHNVWV